MLPQRKHCQNAVVAPKKIPARRQAPLNRSKGIVKLKLKSTAELLQMLYSDEPKSETMGSDKP